MSQTEVTAVSPVSLSTCLMIRVDVRHVGRLFLGARHVSLDEPKLNVQSAVPTKGQFSTTSQTLHASPAQSPLSSTMLKLNVSLVRRLFMAALSAQ